MTYEPSDLYDLMRDPDSEAYLLANCACSYCRADREADAFTYAGIEMTTVFIPQGDEA